MRGHVDATGASSYVPAFGAPPVKGWRQTPLIVSQEPMTKEEFLEFSGAVSEVLPNATFRVKLENDREIIAHATREMRETRIPLVAGDKVLVELTPYDLTKGRITFRVR